MKRIQVFLMFLWVFFISNISSALANQSPVLDLNKLRIGEQTLRIGYFKNYPPFFYGNPVTGFNIDILTTLTNRLHIKNVQYIGFDNAKAIADSFNSGNIDLIGGLWSVPELPANVLPTQAYFIVGGIGFGYKNNLTAIKTANDLKGHTIGALKGGYIVVTWLPKNNIDPKTVKVYDNTQQLFDALQAGQIDIAITHYTLLSYMKVHQMKDLTVVLVKPMKMAFGLHRQDTEFNNQLNRELQALWDSQELYTMKKKYLQPLSIEPAKFYKK